jgi:hypothetical protein
VHYEKIDVPTIGEARVSVEPLPHFRILVGGVVVEDQVHDFSVPSMPCRTLARPSRVDALLDAMVNMDQRRKAIFVAFHNVMTGMTYVRLGESWSPNCGFPLIGPLKEVRVIIEERRVSPRSDFINDRVNARDHGDKLSDIELFDQIFGICGASLSATSRAAGGALYLLYTYPEQLAQLICNPAVVPTHSKNAFVSGAMAISPFRALPLATPRSEERLSSRAWWYGHRRLPRTTTRTSFLTRQASMFIAGLSGYSPSVRAHITASATSLAAPRSLSQSGVCWRASLKHILLIPTSLQSMAARSANCGCKACR